MKLPTSDKPGLVPGSVDGKKTDEPGVDGA